MSLRTEISEQPAVLRRMLGRRSATADALAELLAAHTVDSVYLAARGTSDNAGRYAQYLWGAALGLPVALAAPSLFTVYRRPPRFGRALVVGISQSGASPDIVAVLDEARRQGRPTLAITNTPESPLGRAADLVVDTAAGVEHAVAATKTYTSQLMAIALLALVWPARRETWPDEPLGRVPEWIEQVLDLEAAIATAAERYRRLDRCVVLGRGFHYATAHEWSLKLEELTYAVAQPYSPSDFQHGPIAMVDRGFPVLAVVSRGATADGDRELLAGLVAERRVDLVAISNDPAILDLADTPLPLPADLPEWLSPLVAIVPAQLFTYHVARAAGRDTEAPRGLSKVTLTH